MLNTNRCCQASASCCLTWDCSGHEQSCAGIDLDGMLGMALSWCCRGTMLSDKYRPSTRDWQAGSL